VLHGIFTDIYDCIIDQSMDTPIPHIEGAENVASI
jgi:hypothetical protein